MCVVCTHLLLSPTSFAAPPPINKVHARIEGEKQEELERLKSEEDRLKRERREKVLQARKEAIAALAAGGEVDAEEGG